MASHRLEREAILIAEEMAAYSPVAYRISKTNLRERLHDQFVAFTRDRLEGYVDVLAHEETLSGIKRSFERLTAKPSGQP